MILSSRRFFLPDNSLRRGSRTDVDNSLALPLSFLSILLISPPIIWLRFNSHLSLLLLLLLLFDCWCCSDVRRLTSFSRTFCNEQRRRQWIKTFVALQMRLSYIVPLLCMRIGCNFVGICLITSIAIYLTDSYAISLYCVTILLPSVRDNCVRSTAQSSFVLIANGHNFAFSSLNRYSNIFGEFLEYTMGSYCAYVVNIWLKEVAATNEVKRETGKMERYSFEISYTFCQI